MQEADLNGQLLLCLSFPYSKYKLIVMHELGTGRVYNYILSLILDKHYNERNSSEDIKSLSDWKNYSGIAIYSSSRTGAPMSIARLNTNKCGL